MFQLLFLNDNNISTWQRFGAEKLLPGALLGDWAPGLPGLDNRLNGWL